MKILCHECGKVIDKDIYIDGIIVEGYQNIYGTHCDCGHFIPPVKKPFFQEKEDMKMDILKEEMREKLRKNIKGEE